MSTQLRSVPYLQLSRSKGGDGAHSSLGPEDAAQAKTEQTEGGQKTETAQSRH